jgi:hypothetical protein
MIAIGLVTSSDLLLCDVAYPSWYGLSYNV